MSCGRIFLNLLSIEVFAALKLFVYLFTFFIAAYMAYLTFLSNNNQNLEYNDTDDLSGFIFPTWLLSHQFHEA